MAVVLTPVSTSATTSVTSFIDRILSELGAETDGTGYWSRADVLNVLSDKQREITREGLNLLATSAAIDIAASATEITVESNGNLLAVLAAFRVYGGTTTEIYVYDMQQLSGYDSQWRTRTGSLLRGVSRFMTADGKVRPYPIMDNADNDLICDYLKIADKVTVEGGYIEIPEADIACLEYAVKAALLRMERDGKDAAKANEWLQLYRDELQSVRHRAIVKREGTFRTLQERSSTGESYSWLNDMRIV